MDAKEDQDVLHSVVNRFPKSGPTIRQLFEMEEGFRELCGDYVECLAVLDRLRRAQGGNETAIRLEQYCELRANLEAELLISISESMRK